MARATSRSWSSRATPRSARPRGRTCRSIDWDDVSTDNPNEFFIDFSAGPFLKSGVLGDNEIPIDIAAGTQNDLLLLSGRQSADNFSYGTEGINLNAGETAGDVIDEDLTFSGVEFHTVNGWDGDDVISAAGGKGNGAIFPTTLALNGQSGNDTITGGGAGDDLSAESSFDVLGADILNGGAGNDDLFSAGGNDQFDPGPGTTDDLFFSSAAAGLTLDLSITGSQQTGIGTMTLGAGIERVFGSNHADVLLGTTAADHLFGQAGNDVLAGLGGADELDGNDDDDLILPRDGEADSVECGNGADSVAVELVTPDPDTINVDCETRTKLDTSVAGGPTGRIAARSSRLTFASNEKGVTFECSLDGKPFIACPATFTTPVLADGSHTVAVRSRDRLGFADATAASRTWVVDGTGPLLTGLVASRKTFRLGKGTTPLAAAKKRKAKRGTRISFKSSEAGTARIVVTPLVKGRKVGKRCLKATRKRRKRKSCTRLGRPTTLSRAVKAGANTIPFTGRLGGKSLKPGRYRIEVSLTDSLGNRSPAQRLTIRVVK